MTRRSEQTALAAGVQERRRKSVFVGGLVFSSLALAALFLLPSYEGKWPLYPGWFALCVLVGPAGIAVACLASRWASRQPRVLRLLVSLVLYLVGAALLLILAVNLGKITP